MYQLLKTLSEKELRSITVSIRDQYVEFYHSIYKYIRNVTDLVTFLNWHGASTPASTIEAVIKWILNHPSLRQNRIY